ncbi:hypothetical protein [Salinibacterium sp. NK8237]|uniref:hypothetical protein n=1 Tax=Salinibacterium sp. NK8237 TaxID=2792038 RepID=UPI0018CEE31E|nr:hypothetical protein [Salinibacterium sp. NK8237]MBH0129348.1 hypothetical protein [Salinibacterium sp. NK8237]
MATISTGRVSITPMRATTSATLNQICAQLGNNPPVVASLSPGWAIFDETDAGIGVIGGSPSNLAHPHIYPQDGAHPERLIARYYHWVHDASREAVLAAAGISPTLFETHRLEAVDFVFSEENSSNDYLVLASTRTESELNPPIASVLNAMLSIDPSSEFDSITQSAIHVGGSDFFLWMVERRTTNPVVDANLTIASITGIETRDNRARQNLLRDEIDGDRANFLTAVADGHDLGPIRFTIRIPSIPAKISLTLWADGSFTLLLSGTHYAVKAGVQNESLQAVYDLAYVHLPRLIAFYRADTDWTTSRRLAYRTQARLKLEIRYSAVAAVPAIAP